MVVVIALFCEELVDLPFNNLQELTATVCFPINVNRGLGSLQDVDTCFEKLVIFRGEVALFDDICLFLEV